MSARTSSLRPPTDSPPVRVRFEQFELDEANAILLHEGKAVAMAPTPFAVLCALVRQPGSLLTKNALLDQVWGHQFVSESVLKTVISELRTVLNDDARNPRLIETVSRRGYRFIAPTLAPAASPRASSSEDHSQPAQSFVGRAEALARLHHAWDRACSGKRTLVWVAGEPGIGKTTLIEHFIRSLGDILCIRGQCVDQYGSGEPYLPVLEALSELCRIDGTLIASLRTIAPTWLLQLPWFTTSEERDALRRELAGVASDRMLREMGELLDRSAERRPLLLVTEDLHWSDRATIQLIDYVARRRGSGCFMWLASFRLAEVVALDHPLNHLRRELRVHGLVDEIVLDPFSETEVAEYLAKRAPSIASDEAFVRALHERTDGLPLFVASFTREMSARAGGDGGRIAPEQVAKVAIPENVSAIVDHYIARLGNDQRAVLSAAAVCGVKFRIDTIAAALQRDAGWVGDVCEELAREQLWVVAPRADEVGGAPTSPYSFRHALFCHVLYERTSPSVRAQLHRRIGAALERERTARVPVTSNELAMHFERAGDATAAVRYYAEAAEAALANFSPEECLGIVDRATRRLEHAPDGVERNELEITIETLRGLASTRVVGAGSEAKRAFQRAYLLLDEAPQHPMRARLLHGFGFMLTLRAEYAEALTVADRAEALGAATSDPALLSTACTVHGQVDQLQGRSPAARTWLERGLALTERIEVPPGAFLVDPQVALLGLLTVPLVHLGLVEHARNCAQRACARADALGSPMTRLVAIWYSALCEVRLGNAERVAALADQMRALVDQFTLAHGRTACRWFRGWADARMAAPGEGYRRIREAYDDNVRLGMLIGASEILGYATEALLLAGDLDGAQRQLDEALQIAEKLGERVYLPQLLLVQAAIARARGESAAAAASIRNAIAEAKSQQAPWLELIALTELCEHHRPTSKDRAALAAVIAQLPEAADTTVVGKARALLDKVAAR